MNLDSTSSLRTRLAKHPGFLGNFQLQEVVDWLCGWGVTEFLKLWTDVSLCARQNRA